MSRAARAERGCSSRSCSPSWPTGRPGGCRGGEQRRLHTAIAVVHRPRVVLLDEPTAGADTQTRERILQAVRDLAADGAAVVYTTHYLPEVEALDADVALLEHGRDHRARGGRRARRAARRARASRSRTPTGASSAARARRCTAWRRRDPRRSIRPSLEAAYLALTGRRSRANDPQRAAPPAPRPRARRGARRHAARADDAAQRRDGVDSGQRGLRGRARLRADRAGHGVRVRVVRDRGRRLRDLPRARLAHVAAAARGGPRRPARCSRASSPCRRLLVAAQHVVLFGFGVVVPGPGGQRRRGSPWC